MRDRSIRISFAEVVALLGLKPLLAARPWTLSGGGRQRVALGRALLAQPRLLLMDEPLASLDQSRKSEVIAYIEDLRDAFRLPIVYVSHAIEEVVRLASAVVLLSAGRVLATGPAESIMANADLQPAVGRFEAGGVLNCVVTAHDDHFGLSTLGFDGGELRVPRVAAPTGAPLRVRIRARDVSASNQLTVTIERMVERAQTYVDIELRVGNSRLLALVTKESVSRLALRPGLALGR